MIAAQITFCIFLCIASTTTLQEEEEIKLKCSKCIEICRKDDTEPIQVVEALPTCDQSTNDTCYGDSSEYQCVTMILSDFNSTSGASLTFKGCESNDNLNKGTKEEYCEVDVYNATGCVLTVCSEAMCNSAGTDGCSEAMPNSTGADGCSVLLLAAVSTLMVIFRG